MENIEQNQDNKVVVKNKKDWKKILKDVLYYGCIAAIICILIYMHIGSRPFKLDNLSCQYKEKQDKIVCTQVGEVVPEWLDLNETSLKILFGSDAAYTMQLIFAKDAKNYISMKMTDNVFVAGMNRKFIYELEEQSLQDYIHFKNFAKSGDMNNWGSTFLYCSDKNVDSNELCKGIKARYKKN